MDHSPPAISRRQLLATGAASIAATGLASAAEDPIKPAAAEAVVSPPEGKQILLSVKLSMITKKIGDKKLTLSERLSLAADAGLDGVDFDEAGNFTAQEARAAVQSSGVFVHNAINHDHWKKRLTSSDAKTRAEGAKNIAHCIRLSHAAGGNSTLLVIGQSSDGPAREIEERSRQEIKKLIPLAAAYGQPILFENVWNKMFYDPAAPPEQSAQRHIDFIDSFKSHWVGQYFDIGNHWKYGQPGDWIRQLGHRCIKLDLKGFSRAKDKFTEINAGDLPWQDVQKALQEINFTGWATAEVPGGNTKRLKTIRQQMQQALAL